MQIYTGSTGDPTKLGSLHRLNVGVMINGDGFNERWRGLPVAIDNGAYSAWVNGYGFDEYRFLRTLSLAIQRRVEIDFVATPDIVAGGLDSLEFSLMWEKRLKGHPLYLVVQDGMDMSDIIPHLNLFRGIFVGGTMEWKIQTSEAWVKFAHDNGVKCHIGRIGTLEKIKWAEKIGADSIDSTNFARHGTFHVIQEWKERKQGELF